MMVQARKKNDTGGVIKAASDLAQQSINLENKANDTKPSTPQEHGAHLRKILIRTGAIATDSTGAAAEAVVNKAEGDQSKVDEERRKQQEEKYGGPPTFIEEIIHGLGDLGDVKLNRRDLLVGKPKEAAKKIASDSLPELLPFPLNSLARILGVFKWWSKK